MNTSVSHQSPRLEERYSHSGRRTMLKIPIEMMRNGGEAEEVGCMRRAWHYMLTVSFPSIAPIATANACRGFSGYLKSRMNSSLPTLPN